MGMNDVCPFGTNALESGILAGKSKVLCKPLLIFNFEVFLSSYESVTSAEKPVAKYFGPMIYR